MTLREEITDVALEADVTTTFFDGLDHALLGYVHDLDGEGTVRPVYSQKAILKGLMAEGSTFEDAMDHYCFNIERTLPYIRVEDGRPIVVDDLST